MQTMDSQVRRGEAARIHQRTWSFIFGLDICNVVVTQYQLQNPHTLSKSYTAQHVPQTFVKPLHTLMPSSGLSCNSFSSLAIALMTAGGSGSAAYNASNLVDLGSIGV